MGARPLSASVSSLYESPRLLDEYLLFHYGEPADVLPWANGPREALGFPVRTVTTFLEPSLLGRALDLGCAVGRSAFELSRFCEEVTAVDYSQSFISAAERLGREGCLPYSSHEEGANFRRLTAQLPAGARPERVRFERGDAMDLRADLGDFELVHAANLLCRLTDPALLLQRLPALVRPGGTLILTTPCTWLEEFTPPAHWPPGGTLDWLQHELCAAFTLEKQADLPFLIREHARKYQWSVALGTCWKRNALRSE
jgi:putative 4-mercaptohistidine N1-methyltranferase